jgi:hypothetical protein
MLSFDNFINEKKSPYKPETLKKYKKKWKRGDKIPFGIEASLKAQGMIPRVDGTYKVSDEYKNDRKSEKPLKFSPETKVSGSHAEKVEQRIHKEEQKRKEPKRDKIIKKHLDFHHKKDHKHGSPDDKWLEGNRGKVVKPYSDTTKKKSKQKTAVNIAKSKFYDPKANKGIKPTWSDKKKKTKLGENFLFFDEYIMEWISTTTDDNVTDIDYDFVSSQKLLYGTHEIKVIYNEVSIKVIAKFDTGARSSSIDFKVAQKLGIKDELINTCRELEKIDIPKDITNEEKKDMEKEFLKKYSQKYPDISSIQIIKSASGFTVRPYVKLQLSFNGRNIFTEANLKDRSGMSAEMLVGLGDML